MSVPQPERRTTIVVTPPTVEPITVADLKQQARIDHADEDVLLDAFCRSAREWGENYLRRRIITTRLRHARETFPATEPLRLPGGTVSAIVGVTYLDPDGVRQTLDPSEYDVSLDGLPAWLTPTWSNTWPSHRRRPESVQVTYDAGFGATAEAVPASIRIALLLVAADLYANRESQLDIALYRAPTAESLLRSWQLLDHGT